jgi:hypothetical protein
MFVHAPFVLLALLTFLLGLSLELTTLLLDVELRDLVKEMRISENTLRAAFYIVAIIASGLGIVVLRLFPRDYAPHDVMGLDTTASAVPDGTQPPRIPHANDPLQSVYVAVIMISGALLIGTVS